jgi:hypothetical protein
VLRPAASAAGAFFVGDERAEKQREQRQTDQLERDHGTYPPRPLPLSWLVVGLSTSVQDPVKSGLLDPL